MNLQEKCCNCRHLGFFTEMYYRGGDGEQNGWDQKWSKNGARLQQHTSRHARPFHGPKIQFSCLLASSTSCPPREVILVSFFCVSAVIVFSVTGHEGNGITSDFVVPWPPSRPEIESCIWTKCYCAGTGREGTAPPAPRAYQHGCFMATSRNDLANRHWCWFVPSPRVIPDPNVDKRWFAV